MKECASDHRFTVDAVDALQDAVEAYIIGFLEDSNLVAIHAKRVTVMRRDMYLIHRLRGG